MWANDESHEQHSVSDDDAWRVCSQFSYVLSQFFIPVSPTACGCESIDVFFAARAVRNRLNHERKRLLCANEDRFKPTDSEAVFATYQCLYISKGTTTPARKASVERFGV